MYSKLLATILLTALIVLGAGPLLYFYNTDISQADQSNRLIVISDPSQGTSKLTTQDALNLARTFPNAVVSALAFAYDQSETKTNNEPIMPKTGPNDKRIVGVVPNLNKVGVLDITDGRFINNDDYQKQAKVALVNSTNNTEPVIVKGDTFLKIGSFNLKSLPINVFTPNDIIIPLSTFRKLYSTDKVSLIIIDSLQPINKENIRQIINSQAAFEILPLDKSSQTKSLIVLTYIFAAITLGAALLYLSLYEPFKVMEYRLKRVSGITKVSLFFQMFWPYLVSIIFGLLIAYFLLWNYAEKLGFNFDPKQLLLRISIIFLILTSLGALIDYLILLSKEKELYGR